MTVWLVKAYLQLPEMRLKLEKRSAKFFITNDRGFGLMARPLTLNKQPQCAGYLMQLAAFGGELTGEKTERFKGLR